ncbi:NAD(P)/FAD-dependent oxidoreductase [Frankia sp. CNm7]|uniref:NAD(P)/FAD-dependent oxidoreductase n=1 Tax=Frankia nepalensis TaxID=1836974 RepID=A0A937R9C9_9ACTN|nr:NAD(P)/FAD-dependent oxidoreductase [Frankia nepalensis]MBL7498225.1 NAD(P)/FAD-dependent oxidoreductase [Frankia nepalensis]MBL7509521.1 NAD(P)/FAD-dependent oxidoreductase [Frankia nepalensis]MBL7517760.1 NAD(P)/FAD-dependent oxidoreductase [Frankia nepalensis]MBL7626285.1 NAD(P)/FAD-dependent oxidoreductase [Frankia nepalensis]
MRNRHAGEVFTTSDDEIAAALLDVSIPTLMMSMVHMTGDLGLIRGRLRPAGLFLNEVQGFMSEPDKAEVRALALEVVRAYRDAGCPDPRPLSGDEVHEMMEWLVCGEVSPEYVPMLLEEMELTGTDGRRVTPRSSPADRAGFPVVVIGCGQSGLLAGIRLKEAGIPFTIVEKNAGVGGTWWENSYPGARVDVGNHFYCYSFEPSDHWTEFFAQQPELQRYFEDVLNSRGIAPHVRWRTEVLGADWNDEDGTWSVRCREDDGTESILTARAVISAVGQLNRPKMPDIPGREDFTGPAFHSARWDHGVDLAGRRVAMIGAGASGFQIAPAIAPDVSRLTVFQRTAQWMFSNPNYHAKVGPGVRWALRHLPFYGRWYRFLILWPGCDTGLEGARVDPAYPDQQVAISARNEFVRQMFTDVIVSQCGGDEELIAKVVPDYPATGKRTLQDDGSWLRTLRRDNVELVRTGIDHIETDAVVTVDGRRHPADVLVFATGFQMTEVLAPMRITGRDGLDLRELWGERPAAYLGITVPGFPNLFLMYGPGTHLAHGASLIFHSECQMRYISRCLDELISGGRVSMEPRQERYDDWHERTQREIATLVWSQPSIRHSYFKNSQGEIHGVSPWRVVDYWAWTAAPDLKDFVIR